MKYQIGVAFLLFGENFSFVSFLLSLPLVFLSLPPFLSQSHLLPQSLYIQYSLSLTVKLSKQQTHWDFVILALSLTISCLKCTIPDFYILLPKYYFICSVKILEHLIF